MFALITQVYAARAFVDEFSKMGVTTRHELILLDAATELQALPETEVHRGLTQIFWYGLCEISGHCANLGIGY